MVFLKRREFLKTIGTGVLGAGALGGNALFSRGRLAKSPDFPEKFGRSGPQLYEAHNLSARVALVKGNDRRQVISDALNLIKDEIFQSIGRKQILIKPNMSVSKNPLAVTHADAVRAVLEFLAPYHTEPILIGESGVLNTAEGYRNNGYYALEKEYNVRLVDLNLGSFQYHYIFGREAKPVAVRIVSPFLDPDVYIISLARMKTHDTVLVTLALKNVLMAAPLNDYKKSDKGLLHGAEKEVNDILHFNMFHLAQKVYPDLAVIDGFEAMEGDGPAWGTPLMARVALASLDALAADTVATRVMGFDPKRVLYLEAMAEAGMGQGEIEKIEILGTPLGQCLQSFKPHKKMAEIYKL
jgi:uncharacterized protein (DUF362 family)